MDPFKFNFLLIALVFVAEKVWTRNDTQTIQTITILRRYAFPSYQPMIYCKSLSNILSVLDCCLIAA
jgi:hypothetical protein